MMVNENEAKGLQTWQNLLDAHYNVELSNERVTGNNSIGYQLDVETITGHSSLNNPAVYHIEYHIRISLFDALYRRFVGHTWKSNKLATTRSEMVTQPTRIDFKQPVYFHTSILDSSILLAIELVTTLTPKDPLPGQMAQEKSHAVGWSLLRLFTSGQQLLEVSDKKKSAVKKLDLFQGSPRALLYMEEPLESNPNIRLVPGCQAFVKFCRHTPLQSIVHLIPEHVIVACDKKIPGVSEENSVVGQVTDYYLKPKAIKPKTCYIDHLRIEFGVPIDKFEEELCAKVNVDRLRRNDTPDDGKSVSVVARGLRIGVHNGYCYVQKPQFFHVEPNALVGGSRSNSEHRVTLSSERTPSSEALVLRSRLELNEMTFDPGMAVCFQLEYTLSFPTPGHAPVHGSRTSLFHQSRTVMVRWAWWTPSKKDQSISVCLIGGATANPGRQFFYKPDPEDRAEVGCVKFNFLTSDVTIPRAPSDEYRTMDHQLKIVSSSEVEVAHAAEQTAGLDDIDEDRVDMNIAQQVQLPPSLPLPPILSTDKLSLLSRGVYARLFAGEIPDILDRKGNPAYVIDPSDPGFKIHLDKNITDKLQTNEIIFQFLAYAPPHPGPREEAPPVVNSLFFSFHFYRFEALATQRVALTKRLTATGCQDNYAPRLLRKLEPGERIDEGPAGLEIRYHVDPVDLYLGENSGFLTYISTHKLHIDVWDGNSLMLLGSVSVPLKHLLRNTRPAVCALHELDVVLSEHADVAPTFTGDLHGRGRVRPLGLNALHRGRLYLRLGNVGYPSQCEIPTHWKNLPLVVADLSGNSFAGGSVSSMNVKRYPGRCKVGKLADLDAELSELLVLNADESNNKENNESLGVDAERKRKMTRMKLVRSSERDDSMRIRIGQKALLERQERALKERDLRTVASYRDRTKEDRIVRVLTESITTHHTLRPPVGVADFVELQFRNPFPTPQTVTIDSDSPELRVVTEAREWRLLKQQFDLETPLEEEMFGFDTKTALPQVYLQAKETVYIPLRYQTFEADHQVAVQGPASFQATPTSIQPIRSANAPGQWKAVKAIVRTSDGRPLSILQLNIHPQPPIVDQTLRFYNPEQTFLKKCVRLPPYDPASRNHDEFHAVCTDTEVVCQAKLSTPDSPREIFIKAPCGESPSIRKFYLCIYTDPYMLSPVQTWQFYIHSLQRVDVNCVLGETSRFTMALRGTKSVRKVQCFPSHPSDMQVSPMCSFILPANGVSEVQAGVRTVTPLPLVRYMYIHVVDVEFHQLVRAWLVVVKSREPIISKEFTIELPRSGSRANNKMVSYTNPYPHAKKFVLMTSRADLLRFRESALELQGGEKSTIGLRFATGVTECGKFPIHIFINDDDDKNEETFLVNVIYY